VERRLGIPFSSSSKEERQWNQPVNEGQRRRPLELCGVALGVRGGGGWRWKASAVDEGERAGRWSVGVVNYGSECGIQVFRFGSGLKGRRLFRRIRGGGQMALHSRTEGGGRRHRGGGCNCLGKKKVKAYFCLFMFSVVGGVKPEDANAEVACWAERPNGPAAVVEK
jgi:hypothetical protein